jgi:hypothetical protein
MKERLERHRPTSLSSLYMKQAIEAFGDSGDARSLYGAFHGRTDLDKTGSAFVFLNARDRQTELRLDAVLFLALAAESYINEYVRTRFDGADLDAVDRLSPVNKFILAPRIDSPSAIFHRDKYPIPRLAELFALRNRLVHPKPGFGPGGPLDRDPEFAKQFQSDRVVDFILAVGASGFFLLKRAYGRDHIDLWTHLVWRGRDELIAFAGEARLTPDIAAESPPALTRRLMDALVPSDSSQDAEDTTP